MRIKQSRRGKWSSLSTLFAVNRNGLQPIYFVNTLLKKIGVLKYMSEVIISRSGGSSGGVKVVKKLVREMITEDTLYTMPNAIDNRYIVYVFGGGGGPGRYYQNSNWFVYAGGGGGWMNNAIFTNINSGDQIQITIGTKGFYQNNKNGSSGGTTSFGTYLSASGGHGAYYPSGSFMHGGYGGSGGGCYSIGWHSYGGDGYQFGGGYGRKGGNGGVWGGGGRSIEDNGGCGGYYGGGAAPNGVGGVISSEYNYSAGGTIYKRSGYGGNAGENGINTSKLNIENDQLTEKSVKGWGLCGYYIDMNRPTYSEPNDYGGGGYGGNGGKAGGGYGGIGDYGGGGGYGVFRASGDGGGGYMNGSRGLGGSSYGLGGDAYNGVDGQYGGGGDIALANPNSQYDRYNIKTSNGGSGLCIIAYYKKELVIE